MNDRADRDPKELLDEACKKMSQCVRDMRAANEGLSVLDACMLECIKDMSGEDGEKPFKEPAKVEAEAKRLMQARNRGEVCRPRRFE